jgi:hypothetical protein
LSDFVPGEFHCPQCRFVLTKSIINQQMEFVGRDAADTLEPCPNDGSILRPVRWEDALNEARGDAVKFMQEARTAQDLVAKANQAIREACRLLPDYGSFMFKSECIAARARNILLNCLVELP